MALELGRSDTHYIFEKSLPVDSSGTGLDGSPDATIPNGNGGSYNNYVQQPEPALPDASDIVSGAAASGITQTVPKIAAGIGLKLLGLAGMIGGLLFIQGDTPRDLMPIKSPGIPTEKDGFIPKKGWDGHSMVRSPNGNQYGYPDNKGNIRVPTGGRGHGSPHWDVEMPGGGYRNIYPQK